MTGDILKFLLLAVSASLTASNAPLSWTAVSVSGLYYKVDSAATRRLLVRPPVAQPQATESWGMITLILPCALEPVPTISL